MTHFLFQRPSAARAVPYGASLAFAAFALVASLHDRPVAAQQGAVRDRSAMVRFLWPEPDASLTDQTDHRLSPSTLDDKVVAVTFFDTHCTASCAVRALDLASVAHSLGKEERSRLVILAISQDAARDDPAALASFAAAMRIDTGAVTLLASDDAAIKAQMSLIRFHPTPGAADPIPSTVFVFDRRGQMAMRYAGDPVDKRRLKTDFATLIRLDHGVGAPASSALTSTAR